MKKRFFVVAAITISSQLHAQLVPENDTTVRPLDEVVLTSNKYPRKQSETGKVVTIINRLQLERSSGKTLPEVLNTIAGTTIIGATNTLGTNQTVSIRGASSGNVLILLDGIPVNDPSLITNYFDLNFVSIDQVERIEILKGGQSTMYGSDAVAGVINIISKKNGPKKFSLHGVMTGGSYNTFKETVGFNGNNKGINYSAGYTHLNSDGFSTAYDKNKTGTFDKDGYDQHTVTGKLGVQLTDKAQVNFFSTYSYYSTHLDASAYTDEKDYTAKNDNVHGGASFLYRHQKGALHFNYSFNYVERRYVDDSVFKSSAFIDYSRSRYIGRTHYAELYNNWAWSQWELVTGVDYRLNNTDQFYFSTGLFGPYTPPVLIAKMNQFSPYASLVYKNGKGFTTEVGSRWNKHSEYGNNFTFTLNPSYLLKNKAKLFVNLYSAFKTPTLYQLFDPSAGNDVLEPEKGIIGEAGIDIFPNNVFRFRLVGFYRYTRDAIVYTYNPATFESKYQNVSKQKNYGVEAEASYTAGKISVTANYTFTDGETTSAFNGTGVSIDKDTTYYNLYRIPKHALNLNIGVQVNQSLFVSAQLRSVSKRKEFIYGDLPETLKAYATIDLYGEYKFSPLFKAFVDLKNITNKEYFEIRGFNSRKFNFTAGVSFQL